MKNLPDPTSIEIEGAKRILRRRNIGLLLMLLYVPSVGAIHKITGSDQLFGLTAVLFMIAIFASLLSVAFVKCPRCNKMFFYKWYWANGFALKCVHCGLSGKMKK